MGLLKLYWSAFLSKSTKTILGRKERILDARIFLGNSKTITVYLLLPVSTVMIRSHVSHGSYCQPNKFISSARPLSFRSGSKHVPLQPVFPFPQGSSWPDQRPCACRAHDGPSRSRAARGAYTAKPSGLGTRQYQPPTNLDVPVSSKPPRAQFEMKRRKWMGRRTGRGDPAPARDVGDRHAIADNVSRRTLLQMSVQGTVEASRLVHVAINSVLDFLRGIACQS